jgi:uncharacterized protein (DUF1697 family)
MGKYVALLRGINVGTAKGVSMADLRAVFEELGYQDVETVLRSGNVVFSSPKKLTVSAAVLIEDALLMRTGVQSSVLLFDAESFRDIADANPLVDVSQDDSRLVVTFLGRPLEEEEWESADIARPGESMIAPEQLAIGRTALYQWCPDGILQSKVPARFWKQFSQGLTQRNWRTVTKLLARLEA